MTQVGRNKPCKCGSGKKYKRCCGKPSGGLKPVEGINNQGPKQEFAINMGLPGQRLYLDQYVRPQGDESENAIRSYGGEPGAYKVVFTLNRPGYPLHPEYEMEMGHNLKGDSHLAITRPALIDPLIPDADRIKLGFDIPTIGNIEITGYPNDEGHLGKIEFESIGSDSFKDAEEAAYYLLAPLLSYFSTYLDTPLNVYQIDTTELRTGSTRVSFINPFPGAPFALAPFVGINNEWRGYASLYREALNSNSPAYQFLCLFRIIEGLEERHERLAIEARSKGETRSIPRMVIPSTREDQVKWLNAIFPVPRNWDELALLSVFIPEAIGKKTGGILENYLRPVRNEIAHALSLGGGEVTLSIDEAFHNERLWKWLPLTKCIARWMLKREFPKELSFVAARNVDIK